MMTNLNHRRTHLASVIFTALLVAVLAVGASPGAAQVKGSGAEKPLESAATALKTVSTVPSGDGVVITVEADGALRDYTAFTIADNPPRIVFDLPGLRSAYKGEQRTFNPLVEGSNPSRPTISLKTLKFHSYLSVNFNLF